MRKHYRLLKDEVKLFEINHEEAIKELNENYENIKNFPAIVSLLGKQDELINELIDYIREFIMPGFKREYYETLSELEKPIRFEFITVPSMTIYRDWYR